METAEQRAADTVCATAQDGTEAHAWGRWVWGGLRGHRQLFWTLSFWRAQKLQGTKSNEERKGYRGRRESSGESCCIIFVPRPCNPAVVQVSLPFSVVYPSFVHSLAPAYMFALSSRLLGLGGCNCLVVSLHLMSGSRDEHSACHL